MRKNYFLILLCGMLCVAGIVTGTNLGERFKVYTITQIVFIALAFFTQLRGSKASYFTLNFLYFVCALVLYLLFYNRNLLNYFWVFFVTFSLGTLQLNVSTMKSIGAIYGASAIVILLAAAHTDVFDGWDGNMISMIAFYGFILFIVTQNSVRRLWNKIMLVIYSAVYFYLLLNEKLNSRSVIVASTAFMLVVFSVISVEGLMRNIRWVLLIPLFVVIFVVLIRDTPLARWLNEISIEYSDKSFFNGRDVIWWNGMKLLLRSPVWGYGTFSLQGWHNSAMAALTGLGIAGYLVWMNIFYKILKIASYWLSDPLARSLAAAVIIVWIQQSVEMGIIANANVNVGIYCILGLLLARINRLEWEEDCYSERRKL